MEIGCLGGRARAWREGSGSRFGEIGTSQAALGTNAGEVNSEESVGFEGS